MTRSRALIGAVLLLAMGCNSRLIRPPAIVFADGGEYKVATNVDEENRAFPSVFTAFVPSQVPLHPSDAINFEVRDTGEPHTVALGTLVNDAMTAVDALGPTASLAKIENLPQMKVIPSVFPKDPPGPVPKLNRSASERCFLDEGVPPKAQKGNAIACPERDQPAFNGKQTFYSSGILEDGEPFRVNLAEDIPLGSHRFMCLVHRSAMAGTIEIRSPDTDRPTVAQLRQEAEREEESIESSLEPSVRRAATDDDGDPIYAGAGPVGLARGFASAFMPNIASKSVNERVTWKLYGTHSISFNPNSDAKEGVLLFEEDPVTVNPDAWKAVTAKPPPHDLLVYPPSKKKDYKVDGGTWDGEGEWSTGVLKVTKPNTLTYTLRISEPGKYRYSCLVHPGMHGRLEIEES